MMEKIAPFPQDPKQFANDDRISFSKSVATFILEDEDGDEWEWISSAKEWKPALTLEQSAELAELTGNPDENEPDDVVEQGQKRKQAHDEQANSHVAKKGKAAKLSKPAQPRQNTAVFVSNLPVDAEEGKIFETFRKFGVIAESIDTKKPRIKMYYDSDGHFKGEALVVYVGAGAVDNACTLLDGVEYDRDKPGSSKPMKVEPATSRPQAPDDDQAAKPRRSYRDKQLAKQHHERLNRILGEWSSDEDDEKVDVRSSNRWDRTVVVKNAFVANDLVEDPGFRDELEEDMKDEAKLHGEVRTVQIYDGEKPAGVVTIRYHNLDAAEACMKSFDGRRYNGRLLSARLGKADDEFRMKPDDERLRDFQEWLNRDSKQQQQQKLQEGAAAA